tara:strand:- start:5587 stop:5877 length:291 start_codon:yes stop_codon:yes gene_type:complete
MRIDITARHFSPSAQLKELIHTKINKLTRFNYGILNCHVILTKENSVESVEIICHVKGHEFIAHEHGSNFEKSLIHAIGKIAIQAKKYHKKLISHK